MFELNPSAEISIGEISECSDEVSKKGIAEYEKKLYAAFDWNPEDFRKSVLETHVNEYLDTQPIDFIDEYEKYNDEALYEVSEETGMVAGPNCYAFAMQLPYNPLTGTLFESKPIPGEFAHGFDPEISIRTNDILNYGTLKEQKKFFSEMMQDDAEVLGMSINEVDQGYEVQDGEWMIALATTDNIMDSPNGITDFHFYRKGKEGNWYHKPGTSSVECLNAKGDIIRDPRECNRGIYDRFLGYYVVSKKETR